TWAKLQALLDAATEVSIVAIDTHGVITVFNKGAERILGYRAEEVVGIHTPMLFHLKSECAQKALALGEKFGGLVEGANVFTEAARHCDVDPQEWTYVRKDGRTLEVSATVTPVRDDAGIGTAFLIIANDISPRRLLERELREKNDKLSRETQRAEEASRAKSTFLATMSHEIRTPMNAILGMSDLLWESPLNPEQLQYVDISRRAGNTLLKLINDILDLSKIESGLFELEESELDLEEVIARSVEVVAAAARAKGVDLLCRIAPEVQTNLIGDSGRLQQILTNLLGNALKFTETGEINLSVQAAKGDPCRLEITVTDTGIGIAREKLDAIFEDFTQGDSDTTRKYGGTGLGLGICRRLISLMAGVLTVESEPGVGSTFRFTVGFRPGPGGKQTSTGDVYDLHGRRAMIIDENETTGFILQETLSSWGLASVQRANPAEGCYEMTRGALQGEPYSIVFLDRSPFGQDGFGAVAIIRKMVSNIPIVMLTSDNRPGDTRKCQEFGLSGYAVKPVKRADLLRLVCSAMEVPVTDIPQNPAAEPVAGAADAERRGLRILIAEDSPDNRVLLQAYLKSSPHRIVFAEDGQAAVEQFRTDVYDLVLMDMQMPVLDGIGATEAIRAIETAQGRRPTPILALTANALARDIERSHRAGCNAHLTKPVSKQRLLSAIDQYGNEPETAIHPEVDSGTIFVEAPEGLEQIVPAYFSERKLEVPIFRRLLDASDFDPIRSMAHNIKGTGSSFGFPELTRIAGAMESSARESSEPGLRESLNELSRYLDRVQLRAPAPELEPA
ncbi:MAG: response regulator, partial [Acidobacteriota bacterium]|nr:response regulator [Acidobacteriota bacterium]